MRKLWLVSLSLAAGLTVAVPTPALAQSWEGISSSKASAWSAEGTRSAALKWELGYLALSAIDAAQTIGCLNRGICHEGNPIFGKHPSSTKLVAAKVGLGLVHFAVFQHAYAGNPKTALRLAQVSCAVQGSVVALNARFTFN